VVLHVRILLLSVVAATLGTAALMLLLIGQR
jgi:hypothetical protein